MANFLEDLLKASKIDPAKINRDVRFGQKEPLPFDDVFGEVRKHVLKEGVTLTPEQAGTVFSKLSGAQKKKLTEWKEQNGMTAEELTFTGPQLRKLKDELPKLYETLAEAVHPVAKSAYKDITAKSLTEHAANKIGGGFKSGL